MLASDRDVAGKLVSDPRVAFFSFIGSGRVGWMLRSRLAPGARCALEHGGAAPVIVSNDADLDEAVPLLSKGGFYHAGQVCVSVQRVFAERGIARELASRLATEANALSVGDPTLPDTEVGPLSRPEVRNRSGEILSGGAALSERTFEPTVILDAPDDVRGSTREIFGPVVGVYSYDEIDEAIARSNALPYSFQAAVFTQNLDTALRISQRIDAAAVMVNDHSAFRVDWMPFAGLRESGLGIGGIPYTFEDMQVEKMTVIRSKEL